MASKTPGSSLRRSAKEIKSFRFLTKVIPVLCILLAIVMTLVYVRSILYSRYGSFTVSVKKYDALKAGLSLSYTPDFDTGTSVLNAKVATDITNISGKTLPKFIDNVDGEHNGDNYAAYTFYCKNAGKDNIDYRYKLYIVNMSYMIERAVRIRVYVDGKETTYAHTATDGSGPEIDYYDDVAVETTPFRDKSTIVQEDITNFAPEQTTKFTIVIWLEGADPDCVDDIIGGQIKVAMTMEIISINAE